MKAIVIVIGGMADRSQGVLGGITPLQAATTPNLDLLAQSGACGHMYPLSVGRCPSSQLASWEILGYRGVSFVGRAALEALGAGCPLVEGDVVVATNLATTTQEEGQTYVQASPAGLPEEQAKEVASSLSEYEPLHFPLEVFHLGGPFMALVLGGGASPDVTDSDPLFYRLPVNPIVPLRKSGQTASKTAEELVRFSDWAKDLLSSHPVNAGRQSEGMTAVNDVLVKWPSIYRRVPSFRDRWGFEAVAAASGLMYRGMARTMEMGYVSPEPSGACGGLASGLDRIFESLDQGFDFGFIHTRAADEASHTGRPARKVSALEEIDGAFESVLRILDATSNLLVVITADHPTPSGGSERVIHSGESVPVVMCGSEVRVDGVQSFDEVSCAGGTLGLIRGRDVMPLVLNFTNRAAFGESRLDPDDRPYRPACG